LKAVKLNKPELLGKLNELIQKCEQYATEFRPGEGDPSDWHEEADNLLLEYIDDQDITEAFNAIEKWYS
jgi:hypothetical protein